jgi:hypothetical protein
MYFERPEILIKIGETCNENISWSDRRSHIWPKYSKIGCIDNRGNADDAQTGNKVLRGAKREKIESTSCKTSE